MGYRRGSRSSPAGLRRSEKGDARSARPLSRKPDSTRRARSRQPLKVTATNTTNRSSFVAFRRGRPQADAPPRPVGALGLGDRPEAPPGREAGWRLWPQEGGRIGKETENTDHSSRRQSSRSDSRGWLCHWRKRSAIRVVFVLVCRASLSRPSHQETSRRY